MADIRPFRALRPPTDRVAQIASVPYDVVNTEEARALAADNPLSFLHVSRPEIDLPEGGPVYFWSQVVDEAYDIGFAAKFTMGDGDDSKRLDDFIDAELARAST